MVRSVKKGPFVDHHLEEKVQRRLKKRAKDRLKLGQGDQ